MNIKKFVRPNIRSLKAYEAKEIPCKIKLDANEAYARRTKPLEDHLELLRCHYNFLRTHRALKFGHEVRTPAMQAGLTKKRLTFRDIFISIPNVLRLVKVNCIVIRQVTSTGSKTL